IIIGGGLAGSEAAFQAATRGIDVTLYEMRPLTKTAAHSTSNLAELVCSNSLGSLLPDRASGLLINELRKLKSLLVNIALETAVPAGGSLSVDRNLFSQKVSEILQQHPRIHNIRAEVTRIPEKPAIIASGPLTSSALSEAIEELTGHDQLFFFDAVAPIIYKDSIDLSVAFLASRFASTNGQTDDYINCPLSKQQFEDFVSALITAERIPLKENESSIRNGVIAGKGSYFEGCLPIEIIAKRGHSSLCFGPMRPIGLVDPRTDQRPYAALQLRQENLAASLYNMVGFQTNLTFSEQKRVFQMIPGLERAEFARLGQMHRNTFIAAPLLLFPTLQSRKRMDLFFAGQITGIEGYLGNIASGLLAGINAANYLNGHDLVSFPFSTLIGALCRYITECPVEKFQPMKANFGLLPELDKQFRTRLQRTACHVENASLAMDSYIKDHSRNLFT
ncbi:MAG TPA: methylenetetrahydrofolate--tRNA-(uracil(54)-C(5))-methyltransferase (FADH(2)-oxidizing) TrmFO, partial [Leptolinea sp.]